MQLNYIIRSLKTETPVTLYITASMLCSLHIDKINYYDNKNYSIWLQIALQNNYINIDIYYLV